MKRFSDRIGITKQPDQIQIESMNDELRNSLWNVFVIQLGKSNINCWRYFLESLYLHHFSLPIDEVPEFESECQNWFREYILKRDWWEVYNITQHIISVFLQISDNFHLNSFILDLNYAFERELAGYRVVENQIVPITNTEEIGSIKEAITSSSSLLLQGVVQHFSKSLQLLGKKPNPDYENSIKESISAVESICKKLTGEKTGGIRKCLSKLEEQVTFHPAMKQALEKLYGYSSDADGIRHAILESTDVGFPEAKFMLVACSAYVNFIIDKARLQGIM